MRTHRTKNCFTALIYKLFYHLNWYSCANFYLNINYRLTFILILCTLVSVKSIFSQKSFRRHFIIAYDVSTPFIAAERSCPEYKNALKNLFSNNIGNIGDSKKVSVEDQIEQLHTQILYKYNPDIALLPFTGYKEAYEDKLIQEKKNGIPFFDSYKDEISFYHFNIAGSEFESLRWASANFGEKLFTDEFLKIFLKNKENDWSSLKSEMRIKIRPYINNLFKIPATPQQFQSGVSMSSMVYPLIMNVLDSTSYAEEYILIILSDFLTGSQLGNSRDLDRIRDIFRVTYNSGLSKSSPVGIIKNQIDQLASQYYKIDFFQYTFVPSNTSNLIGIYAYKIKPTVGIMTPEDVTLFVDGDLKLIQKGYQSSKFRTNETYIKFTHNQYLKPVELNLKLLLPNGENEKIYFDGVIATRFADNKWESEYTSSSQLMDFDSINSSYYLPELKVRMDSLINDNDFSKLKAIFTFKTKYHAPNAKPVNFVYQTERIIQKSDIIYSKKITFYGMLVGIPLLVLILLVLYLIWHGKPRAIIYEIDPYLDSFERIDYNEFGKLNTPYKSWDIEGLEADGESIIVTGFLNHKAKKYPFNWHPELYLRLEDFKVPTGFTLFLKADENEVNMFEKGYGFSIKSDNNGLYRFFVCIVQIDTLQKVTTPELVKFSIRAIMEKSLIGFSTKLDKTITYNFHLGEDLGSLWMGFDAGTTGSCVAFGNNSENIRIAEDLRIKEKSLSQRKIIPSLVGFDKENQNIRNKEQAETFFKYGNDAALFINKSDKYKFFKSIKKLLGYNNEEIVGFKNGFNLVIKGKELTALLVKGLFGDFQTYCESLEPNRKEDYFGKNTNKIQRAVVAIPNNFTIRKIQDLIESFKALNFKEVRYVYEAEGVLFHYLSNNGLKKEEGKSAQNETFLIYDMGGATINATVLNVNKYSEKAKEKYDIEILGKIGYGVGGDSIDYCILNIILSFSNEFPLLASKDVNLINIDDSILLDFKKTLIKNKENNKETVLVNAKRLEDFIENIFGVKTELIKTKTKHVNVDGESKIETFTEDSKLYSLFRKDKNGKAPFFDHPILVKTIYDNVKDAVIEVLKQSDDKKIDKVIFSGRSSSFPYIKEIVQGILKSNNEKAEYISLDIETAKTAVAMGACWYGIHKDAVRLNNLKTNASFGFKKTLSINKTDVKYFELVEMGQSFDSFSDNISSFKGSILFEDDFAFDGNKVNFFQVMGYDCDTILAAGQKHKFSKIATITLPKATSEIAIKVREDDVVQCAVVLKNLKSMLVDGLVADQDVAEANDEHYTWILK